MSRARGSSKRGMRPRPTLRGWALACVGVLCLCCAAWLERVDLLIIGLILTILPLAAMIALVVDRPWLSVTRSFAPDVVSAGDESQVILAVRNESVRPSPPLLWRDAAHAGMSTAEPRPLPWLDEHGRSSRSRPDTAVLRYRIHTQHRGVYDVGPLLVTRTDPFGMARADYAVGTQRPLLVTPRAEPLQSSELDAVTNDGLEHELLRHSIPSADELIAREYRTGDPLRRVHWRATARHDKLMVRQEEQRSNPNAWILFDTVRSPHRDLKVTHARNEVFEHAVSLVASLGTHLMDQGFTLNIVETGPIQLSGRQQAGRLGTLGSAAATFELPAGDQLLLAGLAGVRQADSEGSNYADVLADGLRRGGRAVPVFLVLGDGEPADLAAVAGLAQYAEPAVAFAFGAARASATDRLASAGWSCARATSGQPMSELWGQAASAHSGAGSHG